MTEAHHGSVQLLQNPNSSQAGGGDGGHKTLPDVDQPQLLEYVKSWRLPYWDWAPLKDADFDKHYAGIYRVPRIVEYQEIYI